MSESLKQQKEEEELLLLLLPDDDDNEEVGGKCLKTDLDDLEDRFLTWLSLSLSVTIIILTRASSVSIIFFDFSSFDLSSNCV